MKAGSVLEEMEIPLAANGQEAQFIEQMFTATDTSDFCWIGALHRASAVHRSGGGTG